MPELSQTTVALLGSIFTFVVAVVGSYISYRKAQTDDTAQFRSDLFKLNEALKVEMAELRKRLTILEDEVHSKARSILKLETHLAFIQRVVYKEFGVKTDDLLAKHGVLDDVGNDERAGP